jgi:hypothetical protein
MSLTNDERDSKAEDYRKGRLTKSVRRPFLTSQMPSSGVELKQPSRQCATLGTTPERIERSLTVLLAKRKVLLGLHTPLLCRAQKRSGTELAGVSS